MTVSSSRGGVRDLLDELEAGGKRAPAKKKAPVPADEADLEIRW
jgi:hypothetical protein